MKAWKKLPIPFFARRLFTYLSNVRFPVGVSGVITNAAGEVLLFKHTYRRVPWGMPSGFMKREEPATCLIREVREESGLEVSLDHVAHVWHEKNAYGNHLVGILYVGHVVGGAFRPSAEVSDCGFFPVGKWPAGMRNDQKKMIARALGVDA